MKTTKMLCIAALVLFSFTVQYTSARPEPDMEHMPEMTEEMKKFFEGPKSIIKKVCWNNTEMSVEKIRSVHGGDFDGADNATKCFLHCVFKGMGLIKDDQLDYMAMNAMMEKVAPPPVVVRTKKALEHCKDTASVVIVPMGPTPPASIILESWFAAGVDMCDTSLQFLKCAYTYDKETLNAF